MTSNEIEELPICLSSLFPGIVLSNLTKKGLEKNTMYKDWILKHCHERTYAFQIRKCRDVNCCSPSRLAFANCQWLPDPEIATTGTGTEVHFKKFSDVFGTDTTEKDKPSLKPLQKKQKVCTRGEPKAIDLNPMLLSQPEKKASLFTVQCAKSSVIECRKNRLVYSKLRLTDRQSYSLSVLLSEVEYSCGDAITVPGQALHQTAVTRMSMTCSDAIEIPYYSSGYGRIGVGSRIRLFVCLSFYLSASGTPL